MKAAAVAARVAISTTNRAANNDIQIFNLIFDGKYHNLFFLRGGKFPVALPTEYRIDAFVRINILYVADMQNMVVRIHGLTDACYNGKAGCFGNFDFRAGEFRMAMPNFSTLSVALPEEVPQAMSAPVSETPGTAITTSLFFARSSKV